MLSVTLANAQPAQPYHVVIDEIMADPSPAIGLPNAEFIELKNVSSRSFNLNGWQIGRGNSFATIRNNFTLAPDSFVIICSGSSATLFSSFGATIGVTNFPSLSNDADQLILRSNDGSTIHAVSYTAAWYKNAVKINGGWSLEMIDTQNPCSGMSNWTSSIDRRGGTPGTKNSVDEKNTDSEPPALLHAFATDSHSIQLVFDEPLDSAAGIKLSNFVISEGIGNPAGVVVNPPFFQSVLLQINLPLDSSKIYTVNVNGISDCSGNIIGAYHTARLGLAVQPEAGDIVINELLFNPTPDGVDYVEILNRGNNIIDLKDCFIANRSSVNNINSPKQIAIESRLLFPGDYMVVTEDATAIKKQYLAKDPNAFTEISSMPSFPDDKGDVILLNNQGAILDELKYDEKWQFELIDNKEGVALERIDYTKITQDPTNWHSAATTVGYGTPGYQNSQFRADAEAKGNISVSPEIFSPDNDGFDDIAGILYEFPEPGYVCNITLFDANARPVRFLARNALCAAKGIFRWDGLDEKKQRLPVGVYIVYAEIFNLQGKTKKYKKAVTLARKL